MTRTCTTFPWKVEDGTLAISSGYDRDQQDIIAVIFTRTGERILKPRLGTPDFTFKATGSPNLIAKKLDVAVEEQCPTIAQCNGLGSIDEGSKYIVRLLWSPKEQPDTVRNLTIGVIG